MLNEAFNYDVEARLLDSRVQDVFLEEFNEHIAAVWSMRLHWQWLTFKI